MNPNHMNPGVYPAYPNVVGGYNSPQLYSQMQQPVLPQTGQTQQPAQQNMPVRPIEGRLVNSLDEITAADVRNDGTICLFPTFDYSCIYAKQWGNNGLISTVRYVPATEVSDEDSDVAAVSIDPTVLTNIMDSVNEVKDMLKKQQRPYQKKHNYNHDKNRNPKIENSEQEVG